MTSLEQLRAALAEDTAPAEVDLAAVRRRAGRLRRSGRLAAAATAGGVVAVVVGVLAILPGGGTPRPAGLAPPATPAPACPATLPDPKRNLGPGLADRLVPFTISAGVVCAYSPGGQPLLVGAARLDAGSLATLRHALDRSEPALPNRACTAEYLPGAILVLGGEGRSTTLYLSPAGCVEATNGTLTRLLTRDKRSMVELAGQATRTISCPAVRTASSGGRDRAADAGPATGPLLPPDVRTFLLCRYPGGNLKVQRRLSGTAARDLLRRINAAPGSTGGLACDRRARPQVTVMAVSGEGVIELFSSAEGCDVITDGRISRRDPALAAYLDRLAR